MATAEKTSSGDAAKTSEAKAKLEETFKANEPTHKSGLDKDGKPDETLSPKQLERAACEGLLSLRPQPSKIQIQNVLDKMAEVDKDGHPVVKAKTAKEAAEKAVQLLNA